MQRSDEIMTVEQLCQYLGVSKQFVYQRTSEGRIPYRKLDGHLLRFIKSEIVEHYGLDSSGNGESDETKF